MTFIGTKDGTPIPNNEAPIPYGEMPWEWVGPVSQVFFSFRGSDGGTNH